MKRILIICLIISILSFTTGCMLFEPNQGGGDQTGELAEFTVRFISNGGSEIDPIVVTEGETMGAPDDPSFDGMIFEGWYRDRECTDPWDFDSDVVIEDMKLYAKWSADEDYHTHSYTSSVTEPTCDTDGYTTYTCECGNTVVEKIDALGHEYVVRAYEPDCTNGGYSVYTCQVCGDEYTGDTLPANGHDYEYEIFSPTCTEGGYTAKTCKVCSDFAKFDVTAASGHSYASATTEPTCTEDGYTTYTCSVCDDTYTEDGEAAKGHTPGAEATCTEPQICTVCDETLDAAKGHTPGDEATCTEPQTCTVCSEIVTAALGHKPLDGVSCTDATYCGRCGETLESLEHSFAPATCTVPKTCLACGETEGDPVGHSYTPAVTPPTCTSAGYTTYTCSGCGDSYVQDPVAPNKHSYVKTETHEPTCQEDGYSVYVCSACGDSYEGDVISAVSHSYGVYGKCTVCGELSPDCITVTYVLNGGENDPENREYFLEGAAPTLYDPLARDGYRFDGWYTDSAFVTRIASLEDVSADITVYAKWILVYGSSDSDGIVTPEVPF